MKRTATLLVFLAWGLVGCDMFRSADDRVARAEQQMAAGDYRSAVIELRNALQDQPDHALARTRLAEVEFRLGDVFGADKDLRRAMELGARTPANAELMAQIQLALGHGSELLAQLDKGELALDEATRAQYRGEAQMSLQQYEAAQQSFESVKTGDARKPMAQIGAAEALAAQGKSDAALSQLDTLLGGQAALAPGWLARGTIRARRGEFAAAEQDLRHARELDRNSLTAQQHLNLLAALTEVQLARGDASAATATYRDLARLAPDTVAIRVLSARIAMSKQDYAAATADLQRAVTMAPDAANARFLLGAALFAQGSLRQAELQLTQVLQRAPENLEARKLLAQIHLVLGHPEDAMQVLLPAQNIDDVRLDMLRGLARLQQGNEAGGVADLERAAAARPGDITVALELATAYLKTDRPEKAVELLSKPGQPANDVRKVSLLVAALSAQGDTREAQAQVDRLVAARAGDPAALTLAAAFFAQQREYTKARGFAQRATELDPKNVNALLAWAGIEAGAGQIDAAQKLLEKAAGIDEHNGAPLLALAELATRRGDLATASKTLEALRKRDPQNVDARLRLAAIYLKQRNSAALQPVIDEIAALGKDRPEVLNSLGTLYAQSGRYDEALLRFQSATQLDSANPVYWLNTARAQLSLGNAAVAREALEKALAAQPGWLPAVSTLAMLDLKDGKQSVALARVAALRAAHPNDVSAMTLEGDVLLAGKDFAKAAAAYEAAAKVKPSNLLALRAYRARQLGSLPAPLQPLEKWLADHPADNAVRLVLAEAYQGAGDQRRAIAQYEIMTRNGYASAIALNNLAWLYYETKDARAEGVARQAYELAPKAAQVADTYGWILVEGGKAGTALELLRVAADDSKSPSIEYHYAVALVHTGAQEEARRKLTELLAHEPNFEAAADARKLLASLPPP